MPKMLAAFEAEVHHGCIVIRDSESDGDLSGWDPGLQAWFVDRSAAIFAVMPGVDGPVRLEAWREVPESALPFTMFTSDFTVRGALQVGDPEDRVTITLDVERGPHEITVLVDDLAWATAIQVVVTASELG